MLHSAIYIYRSIAQLKPRKTVPWNDIFVLSSGAIDVFATAPATAPDNNEQTVCTAVLLALPAPSMETLSSALCLHVEGCKVRPKTCFAVVCVWDTTSCPKSVFFDAISSELRPSMHNTQHFVSF